MSDSRQPYFRYWTVAVLSIAATVGSHTPILGLSFLRLLTALLLLAVITKNLRFPIQKLSGLARIFLTTAVIWFLWALVANALVGSDDASVRELIDLSLGLTLLLIPIFLCHNNTRNTASISAFWIASFVIALAFAGLELWTGEKLESNYTRSQPDHVFEQLFLVSTFDNPNNYAVFLLLCLPFIAIRFSLAPDMKRASLYALMLIALAFEVVMTASRAAIAGSIIFLFLWLILRRGTATALVTFSITAAIAAAAVNRSEEWELEYLTIASKIASSAEDLDYGSSRERYNIYINSLYIISENPFTGVGPGQFPRYILSQAVPHRVDVPNPHSMLFEIATQYGLIIFLMLTACVVQLAFYAWRLYRRCPPNSDTFKICSVILAAIPTCLISLNINSTYMSLQFVWIFFGSLAAVTISLMNDRVINWHAK